MTKQCEPFDLERALAGEPVILRDGSKAYLRHYETEWYSEYPLLGMVLERGPVRAVIWTLGGGSNSAMLDIVGMYPQYKIIHGVKVPTFPDWSPALGETVLIVDVTHKQYFYEQEWSGDELDLMYQSRGLVYPAITKGERAAELHSKAMLGIAEDNDASN